MTMQRETSPRTRRQWITLGAGAVVLAAVCVAAAIWQWHRYTFHEAQNTLITSNYATAPVPVADLLPGPGSALRRSDEWRPATLSGTYRPGDTVFLRNRPVSGETGYHVLVPFIDDSGIVIIIDRGLVPLGLDASGPASVPPAPTGQVTLDVTLRADEPPSSREAPAGQVQAISTPQVLAAGPAGASWASGRTVGAYGQLRTENPAPATAPQPVGEPEFGYATSSSTNLSYFVQWLIFALGALGSYIILWRRESRRTDPSAGELLVASRAPRSHTRSDEDIEDAIVRDEHS
jgi:cytochrome oxidase assembly protein ShyY1